MFKLHFYIALNRPNISNEIKKLCEVCVNYRVLLQNKKQNIKIGRPDKKQDLFSPYFPGGISGFNLSGFILKGGHGK